ncbi:chemotaxis protein methyltransferase CheR [Andreprevotia lacus DSM 23236]|jgi:chemotaxis protein methyltransferase CheR|uniref:Chemotaxis protein methyltransferase n=1 Tax=Andreprevotia lacus DSM 23236 TaxID=1121001 RepID=A0A1W1X2F4_9NEIS|nr:protein-glutamate O-methyltransferase CheR [Andreprevotia lacus]SMC18122.1 chemotaxis protein methyltransferase CheR [Andreprevotia lacus DSM 23236]
MVELSNRPLDANDEEMRLFQQLFKQHIGMHLPQSKKALLCSRLSKRLSELGLPSFRAYYEVIAAPNQAEERQRAIDLITTNETYFFREPRHFDFLRKQVLAHAPQNETLRIWSAASSTGEEAYSIAMLLDAERHDAPWEICASDISQRVLRFARRGVYPMARGEHIPPEYLKRYCLRGNGNYAGQFMVEQRLRERVQFSQMNLTALPKQFAKFDVIFLRNVIIYFDMPTKTQVVQSVTQHLKPGGWLLVGHSESLHGMALPLQMHAPSIYRKPP